MSILDSLGKLLNRDLTGRTWERNAVHPYFSNLIYFGSKKERDCYWEAGLSLPETPGICISVTMTGTPIGPTKQEEQFCRQQLADLDSLFERCREAFAVEFLEWAKRPLPANWREAFTLDGFQVPPSGDASATWDVCYFVEPAGHYFTAVFANGRVTNVIVDG